MYGHVCEPLRLFASLSLSLNRTTVSLSLSVCVYLALFSLGICFAGTLEPQGS